MSEIEKDLSKRRGSNKDVGKVICLDLDLSSLTSVRRFAEAFKALRLPLHVLVNNGKFCDVVAKTKKKINLQSWYGVQTFIKGYLIAYFMRMDIFPFFIFKHHARSY